jgi:AraC-like DNA-binding protein
MSHAYFCRRFRAEFGLRFMEYLAMYRVEKSKPLLRGGLPISEIALAVGFRSFSHFTKTFRTYVGKTPSAYRARRGV